MISYYDICGRDFKKLPLPRTGPLPWPKISLAAGAEPSALCGPRWVGAPVPPEASVDRSGPGGAPNGEGRTWLGQRLKGSRIRAGSRRTHGLGHDAMPSLDPPVRLCWQSLDATNDGRTDPWASSLLHGIHARLDQARGLGLACQAILTFRCCATQSRRYRLMRLW